MRPGMHSGTTTVTIYGQEYTVRSDGDAEYVRRIAAYVDTRMREVAQHSNQVTSLRVAILAALNITDELFRARETGSHEAQALCARAQALASRLDSIVAEPATAGDPGRDPEPGSQPDGSRAADARSGQDGARGPGPDRT